MWLWAHGGIASSNMFLDTPVMLWSPCGLERTAGVFAHESFTKIARVRAVDSMYTVHMSGIYGVLRCNAPNGVRGLFCDVQEEECLQGVLETFLGSTDADSAYGSRTGRVMSVLSQRIQDMVARHRRQDTVKDVTMHLMLHIEICQFISPPFPGVLHASSPACPLDKLVVWGEPGVDIA